MLPSHQQRSIVQAIEDDLVCAAPLLSPQVELPTHLVVQPTLPVVISTQQVEEPTQWVVLPSPPVVHSTQLVFSPTQPVVSPNQPVVPPTLLVGQSTPLGGHPPSLRCPLPIWQWTQPSC